MPGIVIVFETHATSLDNEAGLVFGHADVALSAFGRRETVGLGGLSQRPPRPGLLLPPAPLVRRGRPQYVRQGLDRRRREREGGFAYSVVGDPFRLMG
jgi:hypothetical protein